MARQRHLARAPITEALIDIHVSPRDGLTFVDLERAVGTSEFGYYIKSPISLVSLAFQVTPDGQADQSTTPPERIGLRLHSTDEKYVAQWRIAGFTLSRLPPYEDWERLLAEARRIWAIYIERMQPVLVTRVAARYINNLRLPLENGASYQTYINKFVDVPEEAPQAVESFFQRFQLVDLPGSARVILTMALEGTGLTAHPVPVILDVDAFTPTNLDPRDPELWAILERLRQLKNNGFFGTITERAAEMYE